MVDQKRNKEDITAHGIQSSVIIDYERNIIRKPIESTEIENFIDLWNKYVLEGGNVTSEMKDAFNEIFEKTNFQLIRKRKIKINAEWLIDNLGDFPSIILDQLNVKNNPFTFHNWWLKAKTLDLEAPFYFVNEGNETYLIMHIKKYFSDGSGKSRSRSAEIRRKFVDFCAFPIFKGPLKKGIIDRFNYQYGSRLGYLQLSGKEVNTVFKIRYEFNLIDDFLAYTYYSKISSNYRIKTRWFIHNHYLSKSGDFQHEFKYQIAYSGFPGSDFRYTTYIVDENNALRKFIHELLNNYEIQQTMTKLKMNQNSRFSSGKVFHLALKQKFSGKIVDFARKWNFHRFNNALKLKFEIDGKLNAIYTADNAKNRGRFISNDATIFLNEDRKGSFSQFIEAFSEEPGVRNALNKNPINLDLLQKVNSKGIGKITNSNKTIATIPDLLICSEGSEVIEFGLSKRYKGYLGVKNSGRHPELVLSDIIKSFIDPNCGVRHLNFGIFSYTDIFKDPLTSQGLPKFMVQDLKKAATGLLLIGYWSNGPDWMSRFGEMFNALRTSAFNSHSYSLKVSEIVEAKERMMSKLIGRNDKFLGLDLKEIDLQHWNKIMDIIEVGTITSLWKWTLSVALKFLVGYYEYVKGLEPN